MPDRYDLARFVEAQDSGGTYDQALAELRSGRKLSHWMWFVFPQLAGLGRSATARRYAISSVDEARAYLAHDVLCQRLFAATETVEGLRHLSAESVFGTIDTMKLHSSMTLFASATANPDESPFAHVLDRYFDGHRDAATTRLLPTK